MSFLYCDGFFPPSYQRIIYPDEFERICGVPPSAWDGSTTYSPHATITETWDEEDYTYTAGTKVHSASAEKHIPVYGPGTPNPIGLTREQYADCLWRVKRWELQWPTHPLDPISQPPVTVTTGNWTYNNDLGEWEWESRSSTYEAGPVQPTAIAGSPDRSFSDVANIAGNPASHYAEGMLLATKDTNSPSSLRNASDFIHLLEIISSGASDTKFGSNPAMTGNGFATVVISIPTVFRAHLFGERITRSALSSGDFYYSTENGLELIRGNFCFFAEGKYWPHISRLFYEYSFFYGSIITAVAVNARAKGDEYPNTEDANVYEGKWCDFRAFDGPINRDTETDPWQIAPAQLPIILKGPGWEAQSSIAVLYRGDNPPYAYSYLEPFGPPPISADPYIIAAAKYWTYGGIYDEDTGARL